MFDLYRSLLCIPLYPLFYFILFTFTSIFLSSKQVDDDTDESETAQSGGPASSTLDEGENDSAQDLDASMEDMDEGEATTTGETEDAEEGLSEYEEEEEPSDV